MEEKFYYKSPVGVLEFAIENDFLTSLKIVEKYVNKKDTKISIEIKKQLDEYFNKKRKTFDIKIRLKGTDFQKKVWNELLKIPYGKIKSYSEIAKNIGNKNGQRAVGSACNKNPILIVVPCHRVIAKNGNLSGFAFGYDKKQTLINIEK